MLAAWRPVRAPSSRSSGYLRAKVAQEQLIDGPSIPYTVARATRSGANFGPDLDPVPTRLGFPMWDSNPQRSTRLSSEDDEPEAREVP